MSVEIPTTNQCSNHNSPKPISLPPLSSLFNSPPPPASTFLQTPQQKLPFSSISSTPLFTQSHSHSHSHNNNHNHNQGPNLNLSANTSSNAIADANHSLSEHQTHSNTHPHPHSHEKSRASRAISLPSIDNLTNSPSFKRSTSLNALPLPTPSKFSHYHHMNNSNDNIQLNKSFINTTPIAHHLPPPPPIFQSTPAKNLNLSHCSNNNLSPPFNNKLQQKLEESKNSINLTPNHSILKKRKKSFDTPDENKKFAFISHSQATFLSSEPDIDNARLARRKRRRTSPSELAVLQSEFEKGSTPNKQRRISIAIKVDMTEKAIQIWFQNKRQALRKNQNHNVKEILLDIPKQENAAGETDSLHNNSKSNTDDDEDTNSTNLENSPISSPISQKSISNSFEAKQLPPTGVFMTLNNNESNKSSNFTSSNSSASSFLSTNNDTANTSTGGQTFKFKSSDFGLVIPTSATTRRQKPTMKLNLKNRSNTNNNSNILRNKTNIKNINNINNNLKDFKNKLIPSKFGASGKENRIPIKTEN